MHKLLSVIAGAAFSLLPLNHATAVEKLRVQTGWVLNGEFAAFCSAIINGLYQKEGLEVELLPGGPVGAGFIVGSIAMAQDPTIDIAVDSDLSPLIRGVAKKQGNQSNLKAFAAFWTDMPFGYLTKKSSGISSIKQLVTGKADGTPYRIGVTADFSMANAMAAYGGKKPDELDFVTVGHDAVPLISDAVDAQAGFWVTQAYELFAADIPYNFLPISELQGFRQPGLVLIARAVDIRNRRDVLARFVSATKSGAMFVRNHASQAAEHILDPRCGGPTFDFDQEKWLIERAVSLYDFDNLGKLTALQVEPVVKYMKNEGEIDFVPSTDDLISLIEAN